jgi:hypothetical protein
MVFAVSFRFSLLRSPASTLSFLQRRIFAEISQLYRFVRPRSGASLVRQLVRAPSLVMAFRSVPVNTKSSFDSAAGSIVRLPPAFPGSEVHRAEALVAQLPGSIPAPALFVLLLVCADGTKSICGLHFAHKIF